MNQIFLFKPMKDDRRILRYCYRNLTYPINKRFVYCCAILFRRQMSYQWKAGEVIVKINT